MISPKIFSESITLVICHHDHSSKFSGKTSGFIERSIFNSVGFLREAISNDEIAARDGFLQGCDPRFKCLSIMILLGCVLMSKSIVVLGGFYAASLALAVFSSIRPVFFLKRTLFFIPLFSFFIVVPAIFSFVTPGQPVVSFKIFAASFSITRQGIDSAAIFFMRVLASVSLAVLLVLTTRQHVLLKVLRIFKVPQLFVMTMGMSYRYIFLFLDIIQKMFIAIKSRAGFVSSTKTGRRIITANMAGLWLRSYRLYTQVYYAMLSRGYSGEPQVFDEFHARTIDFIFLVAALMALIGTLWLNRFFR